jgi:hypothetical protein
MRHGGGEPNSQENIDLDQHSEYAEKPQHPPCRDPPTTAQHYSTPRGTLYRDGEREEGHRQKKVRIEQLQSGERVAQRRGLVTPPPVELTSEKNKFGFEGKMKRHLYVFRESLEKKFFVGD